MTGGHYLYWAKAVALNFQWQLCINFTCLRLQTSFTLGQKELVSNLNALTKTYCKQMTLCCIPSYPWTFMEATR